MWVLGIIRRVLSLRTFHLLMALPRDDSSPQHAEQLRKVFEKGKLPPEARMTWSLFDKESFSTVVKIAPRDGERAAMAREVRLTIDDD